MGFWDRMFGRGASQAQQQTDMQKRFGELKEKYRTALTVADQQGLELQALQVQDNRLYVKAVAPSEEARDRFWEQIRLINPQQEDIHTEVTVRQRQTQAAAVGGGVRSPAVTYRVQPGDTLSKISREFYGDSDEYMRIFYANRDKLRDPDRIQVGQELIIPPDENG